MEDKVYFHCLASFYSPPPPTISSLSLFAAEIFLGPKGKHIPTFTIEQSLTIAVPPSPP